MTNTSAEYLSIGQVLKPQGLKGLVKIRPDTDDPNRFLELTTVHVTKDVPPGAELGVSDVSIRNGFVYLRLEEDQDIDAAEKRRDLMLYVKRKDAVPLGEYENFIADMIGCKLHDKNGTIIGTLEDILQPGANDVYVVQTQAGQLLVPALRHVILSVDTVNKSILVDESHLAEVSILAN